MIDYAKARELMVEQQVRPWDVVDIRVLDTISTLPREAYIDEPNKPLAYADMELPIGHNQHMMKPVVEGRVLQALDIQPHQRVLEIGTGSGYLTACMANLGREVFSVELYEDLAQRAQHRLRSQLVTNATVIVADALKWQPDMTFDVICVSGAVDTIPAHFLDWLAPEGRLFAVRGRVPAMEAVLIKKTVNGSETESLFETELAYLVGAAPVPVFTI